jgi:hypothetical protein
LDGEVPDYRIWTLEVKGHFSGPFGSGMRNVPIPLISLPERVRDSYRNYECKQSIATLEGLLKKSNAGGGTWQISTSDLAFVLGTSVYQNQNCIAAWAEFPIGAVIDVLNTVRNRILDFALAVWKNQPQAGELTEKVERHLSQLTITQIFNTTIHGGSANLVATAADSSITFNIINNDFPSLERALKEKGVTTEDIAELQTAVDSDAKPESKNKFGPKVSEWIAKMVRKAADGSWKIGIGAAGSFLAQAIAKYYGL